MLYEFAVEPRAIGADWPTFRFLMSQFGFEKGKLISQFPKRWSLEVHKAAGNWPDGPRKTRMIEMLRAAKGRQIVRFNRPYDPSIGGWLDNALAQHELNPFHAIIAEGNPSEQEAVLVAAEVDGDHPLMRSSHTRLVPRVGRDLAGAMAPMLVAARKLLFVDRYFDVQNVRYQDTLRECLEVAYSGGTTQCEVHFCEHDRRPSMDYVARMAGGWLRGVLPSEGSVRLHAWKEKEPDGEDFHSRDLLTDVGGINVESGFSAEGGHQNVQLTLLTPDVWEAKLQLFQPEAEVYDLVEPIIEVWGDGRTERR